MNTVKIELKYSDDSYRPQHGDGLCADEVHRLFGVKREAVTLVVSKIKPRGSDYYEAELYNSTWDTQYYQLSESDVEDIVGYSDWPLNFDNKVRQALGSPKTVYFWMLQ